VVPDVLAPVSDTASFRDPSGHVFHLGGRVLRSVTARAEPHYRRVRDSGRLQAWIDRGWVVPTTEVPRADLPAAGPDVRCVLEHAPIPFISYPYEWPFAALKAAALLHLDLQLDALEHDIQLSDASAYNVQFTGARPVFIDVLSFRDYRQGDYWIGHRQFCEQFLNPLLLRALAGVPHNAWYRGSIEGIPADDLNRVLPTRRKLSWNVFSHVTLPARIAAKSAGSKRAAAAPTRALARSSYAGLLSQLRTWIAGLVPRGAHKTAWSEYETTHTYSDEERTRKRQVVAEFVARTRPAMLWDFGCNTGEYSELALESGAGYVVGFDADHGALDRAFQRASDRSLAFLPLYLDAANPTPEQGWEQQERRGLRARGPADAVLALAFAHHLAIGRNVPLEWLASWLTSMAPRGVVEFVQKDDPTVQLMLASREDIFDRYDEAAFAAALSRHARVFRTETVSAAGRRLFVYDRS
jgi:ribosomal protein L11 methylase PrmA